MSENTNPRILNGLTESDYRAAPGINISVLKEIGRSPLHFLELLQNPPLPSYEMELGSAFHLATLLPDKFKEEYAIAPEVDRRTKSGKETWDRFLEENHGKKHLSVGDYKLILEMVKAVHNNKTAMSFLNKGKPEQSLFWDCPVTGIRCKGRVDLLLEDEGIIVDFKTTMDASPRAFQSTLGKFGLFLQAGWYLEGLGVILGRPLTDFVFICVEKKSPFAVGTYVLSDESLSEASKQIRRLMDIYSECQRTGVYPGYPDSVQPITLPNYLFRNAEVS